MSPTGYNRTKSMSSGTKTTISKKDENMYHTTTYDENGRHSCDWNPVTGDVARDHSVSNENQDKKIQWPDSNFWDDLDKESKTVESKKQSN